MYKIILRKTGRKWAVIWDGIKVFEADSDNARWTASAFARGLERGITGSKKPLKANSNIKLEGVFYGYPDETH